MPRISLTTKPVEVLAEEHAEREIRFLWARSSPTPEKVKSAIREAYLEGARRGSEE